MKKKKKKDRHPSNDTDFHMSSNNLTEIDGSMHSNVKPKKKKRDTQIDLDTTNRQVKSITGNQLYSEVFKGLAQKKKKRQHDKVETYSDPDNNVHKKKKKHDEIDSNSDPYSFSQVRECNKKKKRKSNDIAKNSDNSYVHKKKKKNREFEGNEMSMVGLNADQVALDGNTGESF